MCVVERQKTEGKWSQHKHFGNHGEQIYLCPAYAPQLQKLLCSPTALSSSTSVSTHFISTMFHMFQNCFPSLMFLKGKL